MEYQRLSMVCIINLAPSPADIGYGLHLLVFGGYIRLFIFTAS